MDDNTVHDRMRELHWEAASFESDDRVMGDNDSYFWDHENLKKDFLLLISTPMIKKMYQIW